MLRRNVLRQSPMPAARHLLLLTRDAALAAVLPQQLAHGGAFEMEVAGPEEAEGQLSRPEIILLDAAAPPGPAHWCGLLGGKLGGRRVLILGHGPEEEAPFPLPDGAAGRVAKPLRVAELVQRLHSLLASLDASPEAAIPLGPYAFHPTGRLLLAKPDRRIRLTEKEAAILLYLHRAEGRAVPREELLGEVWGYSREAATHTLETHVYRLRRKIETDPRASRLLLTEEGGYRLGAGTGQSGPS